MERLDLFLGALPNGWDYAVEVRNKSFLNAEYFAMLGSHGVAHVFNSWTRMPPVGEQLAMEGSMTTDFAVARFLLKPGRTYEDSVKAFEPYESTKEVNQPAREAATELVKKLRGKSRRRSYLFVNNRLEGNAPLTIQSVLRLAGIDVDDHAVLDGEAGLHDERDGQQNLL
jgi:uncharacterized protein YecE (DUF72 family)